MTLSRKEQAKLNYLNSPKGKILKEIVGRHNVPLGQVSDTVLPDDFKFDGDKYVNGKACSTVREYKAALAKSNTDMSGLSG